MLRQAGNDMGISLPLLSEVPVLGTSRNVREGGITRIITEIHNGANPLTVIEEAAEGIAKWLLDGRVSGEKMTRWLRQTERQTRTRFLADDLGSMDPAARLQELAEAFSWVARNNAVGKIQDSALPSSVKAFFLAFKEQIASALHIATDFARLRREGKVDTDFARWLDIAAGLDADYQKESIYPTSERASLVNKVSAAGYGELQTFSLSDESLGLDKGAEGPKVVSIEEDPFAKRSPLLGKTGWRKKWKLWERNHTKEWRSRIVLEDGQVVVLDNPAYRAVDEVPEGNSPYLHYQAATRLPDLIDNAELVGVDRIETRDGHEEEIQWREAWAEFSDGQQRKVVMALSCWKSRFGGDPITQFGGLYVVEDLVTEKAGSGQLPPGEADLRSRYLQGLAHTQKPDDTSGKTADAPPFEPALDTSLGLSKQGQYVRSGESMSLRSWDYQGKVTGLPRGLTFLYNGTKFDDYHAARGVLIEAKGQGYGRFVRGGKFKKTFRGLQGMIEQAERQSKAAFGIPIEWHFSELEPSDLLRELISEKGIDGITIKFSP